MLEASAQLLGGFPCRFITVFAQVADHRLHIVFVGHGRILFPKPEAPGKSAHEVEGPLRHFGRDGNTDRIAGSRFLDLHHEQSSRHHAPRQGEEQGRESVLADILAKVAAGEAEEEGGHGGAEEDAEDGEER